MSSTSNTLLGSLGALSQSSFASHPVAAKFLQFAAYTEPVTGRLLRPLTYYDQYTLAKCQACAQGIMTRLIQHCPSMIAVKVTGMQDRVADKVASTAANHILFKLQENEKAGGGGGVVLDALAASHALGQIAGRSSGPVGAAPAKAIEALLKPLLATGIMTSNTHIGMIAVRTLLKMTLDYGVFTLCQVAVGRIGKLMQWHKSAKTIASAIETIFMLAKLLNMANVAVPLVFKTVAVVKAYQHQSVRAERIKDALKPLLPDQAQDSLKLIAFIETLLLTTSYVSPSATRTIEELLDSPEQLQAFVRSIQKTPAMMQLVQGMQLAGAAQNCQTAMTKPFSCSGNVSFSVGSLWMLRDRT